MTQKARIEKAVYDQSMETVVRKPGPLHRRRATPSFNEPPVQLLGCKDFVDGRPCHYWWN